MQGAIKRENDEEKLRELNTEIANLSVERDTFKAKWKEEKELVDKIQNAKAEVENLKQLAERAEREGDYGKVAEIRYGKIKEQEKLIAELSRQLEAGSEKRLLKEEVDNLRLRYRLQYLFPNPVLFRQSVLSFPKRLQPD